MERRASSFHGRRRGVTTAESAGHAFSDSVQVTCTASPTACAEEADSQSSAKRDGERQHDIRSP
jgi:hypothetical protein